MSILASSILMNCYQSWLCLPCEAPTKEPMELVMISIFTEGSHREIELEAL